MNPAPKQPDQSTFVGRFAARLRLLREKTGMTGEQAADAITKAGFEVASRTYYGWESGGRQPPLSALPAIAAGLGQKSVRQVLPES